MEAFFAPGVAGAGYDCGRGGGICGEPGAMSEDRPAQPYQEPGEVIGWGCESQPIARWLSLFGSDWHGLVEGCLPLLRENG